MDIMINSLNCVTGLTKIDDGFESSKVGTEKYMAPEVKLNRYNHKADIYSLGVIAKELFELNR